MRSTTDGYGPVRLNVAEFTRYRLEAGMSVRQVAARAAIPKSTMHRHLSGEMPYASPIVVQKLQRLFPFPSLFDAVDDGQATG
jgi:AcrR family transcriptional regulator